MATIREGIVNWFKPLADTQQRSAVLPGAQPVSWEDLHANNTLVTAENALTLAPVYRAVTILSTAVAQLSFDTWRAGAVVDAPPAYATLVAQPDKDRSLGGFLKRTTTDLALEGNAFWRIYTNAAGIPNQVEVLNPLLVSVQISDTGVKTYDYNGYASGKTVHLRDAQVKHLRLLEVPGQVLGLGPIQAFRDGLQGHLDLRDYQANFLSDGGVPTGLLKTISELDSDEVAEYQRRWYENLKNGKTAVLSNGLEYQPVLLNPRDALFVDQMQLSTTEVARLFGIPAHLLIAAVEGNSMTYMNLVTSDTVFVRYGLKEYLTAIEDAFSGLLPRGTSVQLNTDEWLRGDDRSRSDVAAANLKAGIWTINEARAYTGKGPVSGGERLAPQTTTTEGSASSDSAA